MTAGGHGKKQEDMAKSRRRPVKTCGVEHGMRVGMEEGHK